MMAQRVKRLPAIRETQVWSLGQKDPLEKEMATHFGTLAWKIPWMEKPGRLQSMESQSWRLLSDFTFTFSDTFKECLIVHIAEEIQGTDFVSVSSPLWGRTYTNSISSISNSIFVEIQVSVRVWLLVIWKDFICSFVHLIANNGKKHDRLP